MAQFGAKYPCFAPITALTAGALPTYGVGKQVGKLVKADLTVNLASGEIYGDDALDEKIDVFSSGAIAMETTDMEDDVASMIYDATVVNGQVNYNAGDAPPRGGLVYYKTLSRSGAPKFQACFYPIVQAALGNDTAATKGSSITFGTKATQFTVFDPGVAKNVGGWRITKIFDDEASAINWVKNKANIITAYDIDVIVSGDGDVTPMKSCVASGGSIVLTFADNPTELFDNGVDVTASISAKKYTLSNVAADHKIAAIYTPV